MNDDRQAGRKEIGGGGEWTALREARDRAYCDYVDQLRRPECLGYEQKLKDGSFGKAELDAHTRAGELLGRHRAFAEALAAPAPQPAPPQLTTDEVREELMRAGIPDSWRVSIGLDSIAMIATRLNEILVRRAAERTD